VGKPADAVRKPADAVRKPADAEFKSADAEFKSADGTRKSADAEFRRIEIEGRERPEGQGEAGRLLLHFTAPRLDTTLLLPRIHLMPTPLQTILESYRASSQTEREKGSYFEELIRTYLRFEASYADLYSEVWLFADWVKEIGSPQFGFNAKDTGIDLVAKTCGEVVITSRRRKIFI
jgi:hypothetical protein